MIKGPMQVEDITFVNIYAPSTEATKYFKQILTDIKGETDSNAIIEGNVNTTFTSMGRSSRQKIKKEAVALSDTLDQMSLIKIYRTFHPKSTLHILFKCTWNLLQDRSHAQPQNKCQ